MVSRTAGRVTPRCNRWEHRGVIARARAGMVVGVHAALGLLLGCAHTGTVATERTVGTAAQLDSMDFAAARDGSWVVLSQADAVDGPLRDIPMELHRFDPVFGLKLFLGDRPGVAIEHPRVSPHERWLVVEREGRLQLVDAPAARWVDLAAGFDGIADHSLGWERPVGCWSRRNAEDDARGALGPHASRSWISSPSPRSRRSGPAWAISTVPSARAPWWLMAAC